MNTTTAQPTTLRDRIAAMAKVMPVQHSSDIAAQQRMYMIEIQRKAVATNESIKRFEAQQAHKTSLLQQAKNNLATANHIRNTANALLGSALQRLAMGDMNSLRAKNTTAKQVSVVAEYNNLGRFWG